MRSLLFFTFFISILLYLNSVPIRLIGPKEGLVETFDKCVMDSSTAPCYYHIRSSGNLVVEIINDKEYDNMINNRSYNKIYSYNLEPKVSYSINLNIRYSMINGTCHIVTWNNNNYSVISKWGYGFPVYLKIISYNMRYGDRKRTVLQYN